MRATGDRPTDHDRGPDARSVFPRALAFAVVTALVAVPWQLLAAPRLGSTTAGWILAVVALAVYPAVFARGRRRAVLALVAGGASAGTAVLAAGLAGGVAALVTAAVGAALIRSAFLVRRSPLRAVAVETTLLVVGALVVRWLGGGGPFGPALALWGFFLVQSAFALLGDGVTEQEDLAEDAYERSRRHLLDLLTEDGSG